MKVFAIKDEEDKQLKTLAYLIYYEREKKFYIELPENADPWEVPLLLDSFVRRGEFLSLIHISTGVYHHYNRLK